jgi:glycosyltransferase involved in cell wall biosynthesis
MAEEGAVNAVPSDPHDRKSLDADGRPSEAVTSQRPRVSVVTPVYNGEAYLGECIESVLAQTHPDWDYTIVDNCSTDRTLEIARGFASRDSRIRVERNAAFVGVVQNHNIALRQISPESRYCKVVAADDWLFPECLERMVAVAEQHPSVAIVGAYGLRGGEVCWDGLPYPSTVVPGRDLCRRSLRRELSVFGAPTTLLYRSTIVRSRHAFYNESNLHSDTEACLEFLAHHDFGFVHQVLTYMRAQQGSLSSDWSSRREYFPEILYQLEKYGPVYLSDDEFRDRLRKHLRGYYRELGRQVFRRPGAAFWDYHREKLAECGHPLNGWRVAGASISAAFWYLFNRETIAAVARMLRPRRAVREDARSGVDGPTLVPRSR